MKLILAGNSMASYPQGGGHWSVRLQYMHSMKSLGHEVIWMEILRPVNPEVDRRRIDHFLRWWSDAGFARQCAVVLCQAPSGKVSLEESTIHGIPLTQLRKAISEADLLWNFHCSMKQPLLSEFSRTVLIDLDPGHLQVSAMHWDMGIEDHDLFFTVGLNMHASDCEVPTCEKTWHSFLPPIHLPLWNSRIVPAKDAPLTSVTQWTWGIDEQLWLGDRLLSPSKRDAYLRYLELPLRCRSTFELAANIKRDDTTGDRELLQENGWRLVHPHEVVDSVAKYREYLQYSLGEIGCAKPVHSSLLTGWFSDRSAAYLASGRPVIAEDTGLRPHLPTGTGLQVFSNLDEAADAVENLRCNYTKHRMAAREIAEAHFDARKVITRMLDVCG